MNKSIETKIGQLNYEISLLEHSKKELTGVTIRTEELKDLVKNLSIPRVVKSLPTKRDFILWNAPKNAVKDGLLLDENWIDDEESLHHEVFEDFINWWATQK